MKTLPTICPACKNQLKVKGLICQECDTQIDGLFELPVFVQLSPQDQVFLVDFVKASGSLKEMARILKLSYPTVRNRLDEIIKLIKTAENTQQNNLEQEK